MLPARVQFLSAMLLSVRKSDCSNTRVRIRQLAAVSEDAFTSQPSWCRCELIFFRPYLGPPSEFFFSVPGSPTHTGTVLNTSTAETHNDPKRGSERASRRKPIRQTVRYSYG